MKYNTYLLAALLCLFIITHTESSYGTELIHFKNNSTVKYKKHASTKRSHKKYPKHKSSKKHTDTNIAPIYQLTAGFSDPLGPVPILPAILPTIEPIKTSPTYLPNYIEGGLNYHSVSNNQGNWFGQYVKGEAQFDKRNRWRAEISHQRAFKETGAYASIANIHEFNSDWYSDISVGTGTDAFFLPRVRVDAFLNRKFLPDRNFIGTVGTGVYRARRTYTDYSGFIGGTYYFPTPWILQGGVRFNVSNPGSVFAPSGFVAVTQGKQKEHFITARYGVGREAYQLISPNKTINEFTSYDLSLNVRKWVTNDWGVTAKAEYYKNPNYHRTGATLGIFKEF